MKIKYYFIFLLMPLAGFYLINGNGIKQVSIQTNALQPAKALKALEAKLNRKLEIEWNMQSSLPVFVGGKLTEAGYSSSLNRPAAALRFLSDNKELFGLKDPANELKLISSETDEQSMTHLKYQQMVNNVEVFHGQMVIHFNGDGSIESVNGRYLPTPEIDLTPSISKSAAISIAKSKLGNHKGSGEDARLMIYSKGLNEHLAYGVKLPSFLKPNMIVFVDAKTGEVLKIDDGIRYDGPVKGKRHGTKRTGKTSQHFLKCRRLLYA